MLTEAQGHKNLPKIAVQQCLARSSVREVTF